FRRWHMSTVGHAAVLRTAAKRWGLFLRPDCLCCLYSLLLRHRGTSMKLYRLVLALAAIVRVIGVASLCQTSASNAPAGSKMVQAAEKFLDSLPGELKRKATFTFDDKERINFHFVPLQDKARNPTRKGVRLEEMSKESREAALALLKAG